MVDKENWAVVAIRKHIGPNKSLPCAGIAIRIDESSVYWVIVSALQVIESGFAIVIVSAIPQWVDLSQSTGAGENIAPRIILICRDRLILKAGDIMDQLHHVALQIQNVIICLEARSVRRVLERKRLPGCIIDEIEHGCQSIICSDRFTGHFAVQGQILMRDSLRSGDVHPLRRDGFIFSRGVRLDRLALAAGHDLTGTGRLRRDDDVAIVLQRNKDQREQEFCLVQGVTSFLRGWGPAKGKSFVFSRSFSFRILFKLHTI